FAALNVATARSSTNASASTRAPISSISSKNCQACAARPPDPCSPGQPLGPQVSRGEAMAAAQPSLPVPFHSHVLVLVESGGTLLRPVNGRGTQAWLPHQHPPAAPGDPRLRRGPQRRGETLQMDEDGRRDPGKNAALRSPH